MATPMKKNTHEIEHDPKVTPWAEPVPKTRVEKRGWRDILVYAAALFLLVYVVLFLVGSLAASAGSGDRPSSSGGSFFSVSTQAAWIPIQGEITSGSGSGIVDYVSVVAALEEADADARIGVIFLDIDSPGGGVVASRQIVSKIREMEKPVVSWIGDSGASGAYYIAAASDYIVADPDSLTGSIGVISVLPNVSKLLENLGVQVNTIQTGELKDIGSPFNELSEEERVVFEVIIQEAFESFVADIRSFRGEKLDATAFEGVLDGRILSGRQAQRMGLIDATGTREDALRKAGEIVGIAGKPELVAFIDNSISWTDFLFSAGSKIGEGIQIGVTQTSSPSASIRAE
ncbi:MAG: signal peptide peptidase SppA [archaeon]